MRKYSNNLYITKILLNFPMIFRPIVSEVLRISENYFASYNDYLNFLRALVVGEPSDIIKITNYDFSKTLIRIKGEYKNDFFYLVSKAKEFMPPFKFLSFLEKLYLSGIEFR